MAKSKKALKKALTAAAIGVGAYYGAGGILCAGVLSRPAVNKAPEEALNDPSNMHRYINNEDYRLSDDWYIANTPATKSLINRSGKTIHAEIINAKKDSHLWLVLNHGYTSRPRSMAKQGRHFHENGYNVLMPYMRGHRLSEHKFCSMGYFDKDDVCDWISYIVSMDPDAQIVVMGCSMGGAITMLVTGEELPDNVKCAVEDCGYTSCYDEFGEQITNITHLPRFPFLNAADSFAKAFLGFGFEDCSPLEAVGRSKTPTLFIHGTEDMFVPFWMRDILFDACTAEKDKLDVPDAAHDESCEKHPEIYWPKIDGFIAKYIKK